MGPGVHRRSRLLKQIVDAARRTTHDGRTYDGHWPITIAHLEHFVLRWANKVKEKNKEIKKKKTAKMFITLKHTHTHTYTHTHTHTHTHTTSPMKLKPSPFVGEATTPQKTVLRTDQNENTYWLDWIFLISRAITFYFYVHCSFFRFTASLFTGIRRHKLLTVCIAVMYLDELIYFQ